MRTSGSNRLATAKRFAKILMYAPQFDVFDTEALDRMAAWFQCSRRTVYRDIEALRIAGVQLPALSRPRKAA